MQTYVAFLRGINVSGQKLIKMADLREYLKELSFLNVKTYIQSGNIVFNSPLSDGNKLANQIASLIEEKYSFDVPVMVKTNTEMKDIFENNPFLPEHDSDINYLLVTMLSKQPDEAMVSELKAYANFGEQYIHRGKELYLYFPNGYGRSKLSNNFVEKKLGISATTRNWKTITKMVEMIN